MHHRKLWTIALIPFAFCSSCPPAAAQTNFETSHRNWAAQTFPTGWTLLKEGEAEGTIEPDAQHPLHPSPHLLHITVVKTADSGKGRAGASNSNAIDVHDDHWYDITFSAVTDHGSIGLVFSLETADGKVLARSTLPEIGRGEKDNPDANSSNAKAVSAAPWRNYSLGLHARSSDPQAHLVITPIEPTSIWLDDIKLTPRTPAVASPAR